MRWLLPCFLLFPRLIFSQPDSASLVFSDEFDEALDTSVWIAEIAPVGGSTVYTEKGRLVLDTRGGVTVWLKMPLRANLRIEYSRTVLVDGGTNDRLSDLNTFWMASDPANPDLFTRSGVLESYDSLRMYYVGMGGNSNRTTRFRKYEGNGKRTLINEFTDSIHLLKPNRTYQVAIEVTTNVVRYLVDGETYFEYNDPDLIRTGYFGFRSTKSRQAIDWIRIYQLN